MNKAAVINAATRVLVEYGKQDKIRKRNEIAISAVQNSGMPTGSPKGNPEEEKLVTHASAVDFCYKVEKAVVNINDNEYRIILSDTYLKPVNSVGLIADKLNISRKTYYRHLDNARLEFAELCPLCKIDTKVTQM